MLSVSESPAVLLLPARALAPQLPSKRDIQVDADGYIARLALTQEDRAAAFRLRFVVFNLELQEGLESAYVTGYDVDRYDDVCDHLIVQSKSTGEVVGTYRMQMGDVALRNYGYYSEQEFDFAPFERLRGQIAELGRACIRRDHRSAEVLNLLWRGLARYVLVNGGRYMMGCCSLNSQNPAEGEGVYAALKNYMVPAEFQTTPTVAYALPRRRGEIAPVQAPKLLRAYLAIGAKICGPPAIDREFRTIDFLTMLDLQTLHPRVAARFLDAR
ncbi:MAG TPA: GNAT family N-acyltransferase [Acidobacteriaceae bacterium]|jgi:putative hemolysin